MTSMVRLSMRLVALVALVDVLTGVVFWTFAPRWLLLDTAVVSATADLALSVVVIGFAVETAVVLVLAARVRRLLGALRAPEDAGGGTRIEADHVLRLFAVPSRIAYAHLGVALVLGVATVTDAFRPESVDSYTQGALVVLYLTLVSTATLPLYVGARGAVARALELVPPSSAREAIVVLRDIGRGTLRVRRRFLAALAAPVALVVVGASLLVYAHARNADAAARRADALAVAAGVLDTVDGHTEGRVAAIHAAREAGFSAEIETGGRLSSVTPQEDPNVVVVPLEDGRAVVRVEPPGLGSVALALAALAVFAVAMAGFFGDRIGSLLSDDVNYATYEIEATGVGDVIRGSRVFERAFFQSVRGLATAVDRLGGVFREFAAAQERAIHARAAAERMRGLLLATMSHDLKGPLNAVLGFAALVARGMLSSGQRESLAIIEQRGRELLFLIQTVLDSARVEAGELELTRAPASAHDVVLSAVLDARDLAGTVERPILPELEPGLGDVVVDSVRVSQALTATILAVLRMTERGPVVVRATRDPAGGVRVRVEASGARVSAEEESRMFDAFESPALARRHGSLGLGLSLARAIVEAHGGRLEAESAEKGLLSLSAVVPG